MATNRFDKPIQDNYISLYVPIPFELMYLLGKVYNDEVEKASNNLSTNLLKWAQFKSPSAVDTKRWYDATVGRLTPLVNEMVADTDLLKTPEGRSRIQSAINSTPFAELSGLELSREGMLLRQKVNQELMLKGMYNPLWHDVDFTNYDTNKGGVFNDVSPLAYKSEVDLVKPYVDNLKPEYINTKGGYDYTGVSTDRTDSLLKENWSAIYNTPEALKHLLTLVKQGYTPQQAELIFSDRIYRAGREFAYYGRDANEFAKLAYAESLRNPRPRSGSGSTTEDNSHFYLTDSIQATGLTIFNNAKVSMLTNNPKYALLKKDINSGDPVLKNAAESELKKLVDNLTPSKMFSEILNSYGSKNQKGGYSLNTEQLRDATNDILNNFSFQAKGEYNKILTDAISGITEDKVNTPLGSRRVISGGENLTLASRYIASVAGFSPTKESGRTKVENALKQGKFNNMILLNNNNIFSLPNVDGTAANSQVIKVALSLSDLENAGITPEMIRQAGGHRFSTNDMSSSTSTQSGKMSDGELTPKKGTNTSTIKEGVVYYTLDLLNEIPHSGSGTNAEYINQKALLLNVNANLYTGEYGAVQNEAFGFK